MAMLARDEIFDIDPSSKHLENFVNRISECQKFTDTAKLSHRERNNFLGFQGVLWLKASPQKELPFQPAIYSHEI